MAATLVRKLFSQSPFFTLTTTTTTTSYSSSSLSFSKFSSSSSLALKTVTNFSTSTTTTSNKNKKKKKKNKKSKQNENPSSSSSGRGETESLVKRRTRSEKEFDEESVLRYGDSWSHIPVMLGEVLEVFASLPLRSFVDCTLGAAGHSSAVSNFLTLFIFGGSYLHSTKHLERLHFFLTRWRLIKYYVILARGQAGLSLYVRCLRDD